MSNLKVDLLSEIKNALKSVRYGSVEIFVQDNTVTQITVRNIKKTSVGIGDEDHSPKNSSYEKGIRTSGKIRINLHS